jgi:hypothetical protein
LGRPKVRTPTTIQNLLKFSELSSVTGASQTPSSAVSDGSNFSKDLAQAPDFLIVYCLFIANPRSDVRTILMANILYVYRKSLIFQ